MRLRSLLPLLLAALGCRTFAGHQADGVSVVPLPESERSYIEHVPARLDPARPAPLLLVFHGGGGSAKQALEKMGFDRLVAEQGAILVYPDAIDGHWNDGRGSEKFAEQDARVDDVAYALAVLDDVMRRRPVDPSRVYATGASNGGMFVQRLAIEHAERFAAVASIISSIPEPLAEDFHPSRPLPVLFVNGTEDPIVPFEGGEVSIDLFPRLPDLRSKPSRGRVIGTVRAARMWAQRAGLPEEPSREELPNRAKLDGTRVRVWRWHGDATPLQVELFEVIGGGHTLPGRPHTLPKRVVGRTSREFDVVDTVWEFLADKRAPRESGEGSGG